MLAQFRAAATAALAFVVAACAGRSAAGTLAEPLPADSAHSPIADSTPTSTRGAQIRPTGRFYHGLTYGSESEFNPLTVVVNEGWDMLRLNDDRDVLNRPYGTGFRSMAFTLTHPVDVIRKYGFSRWLRNEVFPLTFRGNGGGHGGGGQWEPNYQLHLFESGMTYVRTAEWYEANGAAHPRLFAAATLFAGHLMNEVIENGDFCCENEDSLTDLMLFDPLGMLLWNQDWMQRAFSGRVEMTNWYGQPMFRPADHRLDNAFSLYMLRVPLPKTDNWKLMTTGGNVFLLGLSRRVGGLWVSAAGGVVPSSNPVTDSITNQKSVGVQPNVGLFVDRNGSLLVSMLSGSGIWNGPTLNVYPEVIARGPLSPGFFVQWATGGPDGRGLRFGVTSKLGIGLGALNRR